MKAAYLALVISFAAAADPVLIEETDRASVYRVAEAQVIVLVDEPRVGGVWNYAIERGPGTPHRRAVRGQEARSLGITYYLARFRPVGDQVVCEKFAERPASKDDRAAAAALLATDAC